MDEVMQAVRLIGQKSVSAAAVTRIRAPGALM